MVALSLEVEKKKRVAFSLFLFDILHERNDNVTITSVQEAELRGHTPFTAPSNFFALNRQNKIFQGKNR
jgi:hypothetical protein